MFGLDLLGIAAFPNAMSRAFPKGFALGAFANTFGNPYPHIKRILQTGKCPRVRIHAVWEDNHRYIPALHDPIIRKEHNKLKQFAANYDGIEFNFSPFCEAIGDLTAILEELKADTPFLLINSVWQGPAQKPALAINEYHGEASRQRGVYNYSWDGDSTVDGDVTAMRKRHKSAYTHFFWHPSFNGKRNVSDSTPRPKRRFWPTPQLIESIGYLETQRGRTSLANGWLWKSHADVHSVPPEPRAYKPVLITPLKKDFIELRSANNKVIERMPYGGMFDDGSGRHRYYASRYGYEISKDSYSNGGTPTVRFEGQKVNPAFRDGGFR